MLQFLTGVLGIKRGKDWRDADKAKDQEGLGETIKLSPALHKIGKRNNRW